MMDIFKCENCGCLMMLNICNLAEYLDRGTVSCPYCGANSEYLTQLKDKVNEIVQEDMEC